MCNERVSTLDNTSVTEAITRSRALLPCSTCRASFPQLFAPQTHGINGLGRESTSTQMLTTTCNCRGSDALFRTSEAVALVGTYPPTLHIRIHAQHYLMRDPASRD